MKIIFFTIFSVLLVSKGFAQIAFESKLNWDQVLNQAKNEKKFIFIDVYATWCGPCKEMDQTVYNNLLVGAEHNDKFISVKVQVDQTEKDSDYTKSWRRDVQALVNRYNVKELPTMLYFTPDGHLVHKAVGFRDAGDFRREGEIALRTSEFENLLTKYKAGNTTKSSDVSELLSIGKQLGKQAEMQELANAYLASLKISDFNNIDHARMVFDFTRRTTDVGFRILQTASKQIAEADPLNYALANQRMKIKNIIYDDLIVPHITDTDGDKIAKWEIIKANLKPFGELGDELYRKAEIMVASGNIFKRQVFEKNIKPFLVTKPTFDAIKVKINEQNVGLGKEILVGMTNMYCLGKYSNGEMKDASIAIKILDWYAKEFPEVLDAGVYNTPAWLLFEKSNSKIELEAALRWAKAGYELAPNGMIGDTYAQLLYKLGRKDEAIALQKIIGNIDGHLDAMLKNEKTWPGEEIIK